MHIFFKKSRSGVEKNRIELMVSSINNCTRKMHENFFFIIKLLKDYKQYKINS